jgi:hypothetical protein
MSRGGGNWLGEGERFFVFVFLFLFFFFCFGFFYAVAALVIITAVALRNNAGVGARRRVSPINCGADSVPGWKSLHGA